MSEAATTAVAIRDETSAVMLTNAQLTMIANTSFVPAAFRGKVPEVLACVATGRALGLPDMTSLRGIHVIEGKATLSAELMVAIVRDHKHSITGTVDDKKAVVKGKRADNGDEMEATFTAEMAVAAGLASKSNYKKHPDDMMWARAVSKLCRRLFADCFAGATYVPEEIEPTADELLDVPWAAGGVAEPVTEANTNDLGGDAAKVGAGSATSLDTLIATYGRDEVAAAYKDVFPDRAKSPLTDDEVGLLAGRLSDVAVEA